MASRALRCCAAALSLLCLAATAAPHAEALVACPGHFYSDVTVGHPGPLRPSSLEDSRYSRSSYLATRAPRSGTYATDLWFGTLAPVHQQRYAMGTVFDIVVYHPSRAHASGAVVQAMDEISRLDRVLSHFMPDSELARLIGEGRHKSTRVEPSLYRVLEASLRFSRMTGGKFDVTIAPLLKVWKDAHENGRRPSAAAVDRARACVGYEKVHLIPPDLVRLDSGCVEIDMGGIGKGYAVDRAVGILRAAGIERAVVNAGGSSIAAVGAPPGRAGWPVSLDAAARSNRVIELRDCSVSTSQQVDAHPARLREILDPDEGAPVDGRHAVTVLARDAASSDALATTLVMLPVREGMALLAQFPGAGAEWRTASGEIEAAYGALSYSSPLPRSAGCDKP